MSPNFISNHFLVKKCQNKPSKSLKVEAYIACFVAKMHFGTLLLWLATKVTSKVNNKTKIMGHLCTGIYFKTIFPFMLIYTFYEYNYTLLSLFR